MQVSEQLVRIPIESGAVLAATLYLPEGDGPFATLMEALPYRMNDITSSYADGYHRFASEGNFAVLRVDVRGTGLSTGISPDEYPDVERRDLRAIYLDNQLRLGLWIDRKRAAPKIVDGP